MKSKTRTINIQKDGDTITLNDENYEGIQINFSDLFANFGNGLFTITVKSMQRCPVCNTLQEDDAMYCNKCNQPLY